MSGDEHNPLLKRRPRKPTGAEILAWHELSRNPTEFWKVPFDPCPYVRLTERRGIEMGMKGTF